jgi:hypothetical protein
VLTDDGARQRNRKMFGLLRSTLQQAREQTSIHASAQQQKMEKIERKLKADCESDRTQRPAPKPVLPVPHALWGELLRPAAARLGGHRCESAHTAPHTRKRTGLVSTEADELGRAFTHA